jgi:hypothetical protein
MEEALMSGSNFLDPQYIGPPVRAIGPLNGRIERVQKLYIWIVQFNSDVDVGDASATGEIGPLEPDYLETTMVLDQKMFNVELKVETGEFTPGPAFAFATAVVKDTRFAKQRVIAWTDSIVMVKGESPLPTPPALPGGGDQQAAESQT